MGPKDKDNITNKSGEIYRFKSTQAFCEEEYIGELGRSFGGTQFHISKYIPPLGMPKPHGTSVYPFHTYFGAINGKYYLVRIIFYFRPDKAMFDLVWQQLVFDQINSILAITRRPEGVRLCV